MALQSFRGSSSGGHSAIEARAALAKRNGSRSHQGTIWAGHAPLFLALFAVALINPHRATAWGDEGHKVIALIAEHYLDPAVRASGNAARGGYRPSRRPRHRERG